MQSPKKTNLIIRSFLCVLFSLGILVPAHSDSLYEIYAPVSTPQQARSIKPGTRVAFVCGACGAVTSMTVGKDRSYLHGFTCPVCKRKFVTQSFGGNVGSVGFSYADDAGHQSKLLVRRHFEIRHNANGQDFGVYVQDR
jgi:predicted RNA-binding Zn-ribbon protein involved in translation (DUF1610 family)